MIRWLRALRERWRACVDYEWRQVPPPNVRCQRNGIDYY